MKIIIFMLFVNISILNIYAQGEKNKNVDKLQRLSISVDLETVISASVYVNFLYEKEFTKKLSLLYGMEYQKNSSAIKINGQLVHLYEHNYYYLKSKIHYYFLPFNDKQHYMNGVYTGVSLKIGGGNRSNGYYNVLNISPGILIGTCIALSNRVNLNMELDLDGYIEWKKEANSQDAYKFKGKMTSYPNLWFTIGYRL